MADQSFLTWPFFDDWHRDYHAALDGWAAQEISPLPTADEAGLDGACRDILGRLAKGGWLHRAVAPEGAALDVRTLCLTRETLARYSGLADFVFAMQGLGSGPISLFGSSHQRQTYLPAVAAGQKIAAFALSEPDAGSDAAALSLTAIDHGDHYELNGEKTWISNAGLASFYVVFARTGEGAGAKGLSALIVDADTPGLTIAERIPIMAPHPLGRLEFVDCKVPKSQLVGQPGDGFKIAMGTLDVFRSTVGAAALGFARHAFDEARHRVKHRQLFGAPMSDLPLVQASLAEMAVDIDAMALLIYRAAWTKDKGAARVTREAAMAKLYATEAAQQVIDKALQMFGGLGVRIGTSVEQLYREIRALRIYEGASEVQKLVIARQALGGP
jgi:acyl-CoA dehydrogenase